ncbi:uncharacterized protein CEXT_786731 [Caerostris extrusa]|uniref:Uncharacterized protein n=1 Tax=Caerostris extrusa TaxID=172846 RepID=A0AAV4M828_CAEEX|nr:uncharacterized protein CEXT_786731 [Caerostris extrusa]
MRLILGTYKEELSKQSWQTGEYITSPWIKMNEDPKWFLCFYPAGEDGNPSSLVFTLDRDNADRRISAKLQFHLCHFTIPVKSYTVNCTLEQGEYSFMCDCRCGKSG